jgi:hypothetical protein
MNEVYLRLYNCPLVNNFYLGVSFVKYKMQQTPSNRVLLAKQVVAQLINKLSGFYGIQRFITVPTRARH